MVGGLIFYDIIYCKSARISYSRIALKDIFATLKVRD